MKINRKLPGLIVLILLSITLHAQDNNCNFRKSFHSPNGSFLNITNKYGDIEIITAGNDSINICATITIKQKDPVLAEKSISLINTELTKIGDTVYAATSFDDKFFSAAYNKGRSGFSVDYSVRVPRGINLRVNNVFGDVYIDSNDSFVDINVSHGNINATSLSRGNSKPVNSIYNAYGNINIDEANWLSVTTKNCPMVQIRKARAVLLFSQFSKIETGDINSLVCDSKYDSYNFESVKNLVLETNSTAIEIGSLTGQLVAETRYGSMNVKKICKGFTSVDLNNYRTPVMLEIEEGAGFNADIYVSGTLVNMPSDQPQLVTRSPADKTTTISGIWGKEQAVSPVVKIRAEAGRLEIR